MIIERVGELVDVAEEKENQYYDVAVNRNNAECREPDEDYYRSVSMKEFKEKALAMVAEVDKMYSGKTSTPHGMSFFGNTE